MSKTKAIPSTDFEFEIYQRPSTGEYFRGRVRLWDGRYSVSCVAASGGNRKFDVLSLLDINHKSKVVVMLKIKLFCAFHKFVFKKLKP